MYAPASVAVSHGVPIGISTDARTFFVKQGSAESCPDPAGAGVVTFLLNGFSFHAFPPIHDTVNSGSCLAVISRLADKS